MKLGRVLVVLAAVVTVVACLDFESAYQDCRALGNCVDPSSAEPPKVTATNPENLSTGVELDTSVSIEFDRPMKQSTVSAALSNDVSLVRPQWEDGGTQVSFSLSRQLAFNTDYVIKVGGESEEGGVLPMADVAGFRTKIDPPGPSLVQSFPAATATGVSLDAGLRLIFSAPVDETSFLVSMNPPVLLGEPLFSASNTQVEYLNAEPYIENTPYLATITAKGVDNKPLEGDNDFVFTTVPDVTPPVVTTTIPSNGQTNVSPNMNPSIVFSEQMDQANTIAAVSISPADAGCVWTMPNTRSLTCTHNSTFRGDAGFTVTISTMATDRATPTKNPLQAPYSFTFFTGSVPDTLKPDVATVTPGNGTLGASTAPTLFITFTEPMDPLATQNAVRFSAPSGITPTDFAWTNNNTRLSFKPSQTLNELTNVSFQVDTGARDLSGNTLVQTRFYTFKTWATRTETIVSTGSLDGFIYKAGTSHTINTTYSSVYVGDNINPTGTYRGFISFPLTTLRNNGAVEIVSAYVRMYQAWVQQRPYDGGLGDLYAENVRYGASVSNDDFDAAAIEVCTKTVVCFVGGGTSVIEITPQNALLSNRYLYPAEWLKRSIRALPDAGVEDSFQLRMRFTKDVTPSNPSGDFVQIANGKYSDTLKKPTLVITYRAKQ